MNIPNDWKVKRLEKLVQFSSGGTPSKANKSYWKGDIPWISASTMHQQEIISSDLFISEAGLAAGSKLAKENDLLLLVRGSMLWKKIPICLCKRDVAFNQDVKSLSVNKSIQANYLLYWFLANQRFLLNKVVGTGIGAGKLDFDALKVLDILLPPLSEQKAIADLLSIWDKAIEKSERLVKMQEKMLKQTSRWLLFGHKRLDNRKVKLSDGRYFKYSCDSELLKISKIAKEVSARNGNSNETVLSCSKYDGFVNSLDYFGKQVFSSDTSNYKVIKKGQFGYPSNHVEEGSIGLLKHCEKGIVSPIYVIFEVLTEKIYPPYLIKLLKTQIYQHIFHVTTSSSVDRRGGLRWVDFSKIKVPIPSYEEQKQIAAVLDAAQHEIVLLKQLREKYKLQKCGLMQKMLTGEWRVKPEIVNQYMEA
jgi:type I restriction enzyme, S subunit